MAQAPKLRSQEIKKNQVEPLVDNPLTVWRRGYPHFDDAFDFRLCRSEHFLPAIEWAYNIVEDQLLLLENNPETPTFENTILVLESATEDFEWIQSVFFNLFNLLSDEKIREIAPKIAEFSARLRNRIYLSESIFNRVQSVWSQVSRDSQIDPESRRLTEKFYRDFIRGGANLDARTKDELRKIDQELAKLAPAFSDHVLEETNSFELWLTEESDLVGLPKDLIDQARLEAQKRGHDHGWSFTLQMPSYLPFMVYSSRRDLREKMWRSYNSRCTVGSNSNYEIILKTLKLRKKRAQILGYPNHPSFVLEDRMTKNPKTVMDFLEKLRKAYLQAAKTDLEELRALSNRLDGIIDLKPWDIAYYSEKLKKQKYEYDDEELRPYFPLEQVICGAFEHARRLYGLQFLERSDIPVYHPEVKAFEVRDENGDYLGLLYGDFFPRESKIPGAWASDWRSQGLWNGSIRRPHAIIACNFTKPSQEKPSLLRFDEVLTLFHEFGHALHILLSQVHYRSLSGTHVKWDFVELPSQIMENWLYEKESLDLFARHYQTNEPIPDFLVSKLIASKNFQAGLSGLRQIQFGLLDMRLHLIDYPEDLTVDELKAFDRILTEDTRLLPFEQGTSIMTTFSHIFSGGYSAGYYSYKWAEVLDSDAFEYFKTEGIFNREVSKRFRDFILSRGNTEEPEELYRKFRGREPDPNALLKREGLMVETS